MKDNSYMHNTKGWVREGAYAPSRVKSEAEGNL